MQVLYRDSAAASSFWQSLGLTLLYVVVSVILVNVIGFLLALLVTGKIKGKNFFRAGFFTPNLIGGIILGYIWQFVFNKVIVYFGDALNVTVLQKSMLSGSASAFAALVLVTIWQFSGYMMLIYIAGLTGVSEDLKEAAKIDGAGEYRTFFQITLPLMKPSMAAVGFMMATAYWNDWQNALLYITSDNKKPLQLLLVNIQKSIEFLLNNSNVPASVKAAMGGTIPQYSATMATVIVVIGPIMVIYPFFQKYFVKGLTVGSVKG